MARRTSNEWVLALGLVEILTIATMIAVFVGALNVSFRHTVLLPAASPGALQSERYNVSFWFLLLFLTFGYLASIFTAIRLLAPRDGWWRLGQLVVVGLFALAAAGTMVILTIQLNECNTPANANTGLCNDPRYCCVFDTPNCAELLADCSPEVVEADLIPDSSFILLFALTILCLVAAIFHVVFSICMGRGRRRGERTETNRELLDERLGLTSEAPDDYEEFEEDNPAVATPYSSLATTATAARTRNNGVLKHSASRGGVASLTVHDLAYITNKTAGVLTPSQKQQ